MIKIVASTKECGKRITKQFSASKNRYISLCELDKIEQWIVSMTQNNYLVEINYKVTFDENVDTRYRHTITGVGCKTYIKNTARVRETLERTVKDINSYVK